MKDYPQNTEQWAQEAYQALLNGWDLLTEGNPFPTENQKERLIEIAVSMACDNREVVDSAFVAHAQDYAKDEFMGDFNSRELTTKINFSLCFLLAYFDAHSALSMISKEDADYAMAYLRSNFDLAYVGKDQASLLSINYSGKI
ncbi:MAG: hypothetical protein V7749_06505 [Cocleimonas sp.]